MSSRGYPVTKQVREFRRKEAEKRQAEYDKLSLQQKLDRLPPPPQAAKQRAKLEALLTSTKTGGKVVEEESVENKKHLKAKERRALEK